MKKIVITLIIVLAVATLIILNNLKDKHQIGKNDFTYTENLKDKQQIGKNDFTYIENLKDSDIISKYIFKKNIKATDIEGEFDSIYKIELDLYKGNIFHVKTKAGEQASGENCYGTYEIKNNILTINRKTLVGTHNEYIDISDSSYYNLKDKFKISSNKKLLTTNKYIGEDSNDFTYTSSRYFDEIVKLKKIK